MQRYTDYEYLIVDGSSTDSTAEWLRSLHGVRWVSEPDKGIYDAMNKGVQMAKGEWVLFLNAGDTLYDEEVLAHIAPYLEEPYGLVYGDIVKEQKGKEVIKQAEPPHNAHRMFCCHQALFTRTALLKEQPFDTTHRLSADYKFVKLMYQQKVPMRHVDQVITRFDTHGISNTHVMEGLPLSEKQIRRFGTEYGS